MKLKLKLKSRSILRAINFAIAISLCLVGSAFAQQGRLTIHVDQPGPRISPMLYGLMTEEINHSYDGGLYAELIQNRIFKDDPNAPAHWSLVQSDGAAGHISLDTTDPVNTTALTTSLRLNITAVAPNQRVGIANDGFWGIPVRPDTQYHASFYAKAADGFTGPLNVVIESNDGSTVYASATVPALTAQWHKYNVTLATAAAHPSQNNRFLISATSKGTIWLNLVSLFPPTFQDRANGNRVDLMQLLADLNPAFLRFPGGNYLEGDTVDQRFPWQLTLGDLEQRAGHRSPWGYRSSDGLGLLEFLNWCEDLHMEPLLAVYAGYSLQHHHIDAGPALQPYVQEALDEIEYATGATTTKWGARRSADGHPDPFKIRFVEIGNEDGFDRRGYDARFAQFVDAIKAKYPQLQCIATEPVHTRVPDVIDDHYYRSARAMELDVHHYDKTPRTGPKIFVGEWATQEGSPTPTLNAAIADAAWLTGLERNADIVALSCYAPLLINVNPGAWQWRTNLIGYDAGNSFGSPSYYAQKMFAQNRGDVVLPVQIDLQAPPATQPSLPPHGGIGVGTWRTDAEYKDIEVTSAGKTIFQSDFSQGRQGWRVHDGTWDIKDGALHQSANAEGARALAGDPAWTDYTLRLKARKLSGDEGFLVIFHAKDRSNLLWWNLGGWSNTRTGLERTDDGDKQEMGDSSPTTIETGRWYDIRIELAGRDIKCYLDDKLITHATESPQRNPDPLFATASRDDATKDVILKVVNASAAAEKMEINLQGASALAADATVESLSGAPADVNTLADPRKIYPLRADIHDAGPKFTYEFPPCSVTVIRLHERKE